VPRTNWSSRDGARPGQKAEISGQITRSIEKALPLVGDVPRRAPKAHVKLLQGIDAGAGVYDRNTEEFSYRVQNGGESPMDVLEGGTSVAAESLGMGAGSVRWRRGRMRISWPWTATCLTI
jgi:hypothetical protein